MPDGVGARLLASDSAATVISTSYGELKNMALDICVSNGDDRYSTVAQKGTCDGDAYENWKIQDSSGGMFEIVEQNTADCLTDDTGTTG